MDAAGIDLGIPDHPAAFIISYLLEIGPVVNGGLGPAAIDWRDLQAWQYCTGIKLSPWQSRLLVSLSRDYLVFSKKAEEPSCMSPISDEVQKSNNREAVARSLRIGFKALMSAPRRSLKKAPGRK
jgi:hypothetical protein